MSLLNSYDLLKPEYDVVVVGSGLGGLTAANKLGSLGYRVLVAEQHYKVGGLATWFQRRNQHIFDISLHGFPVGMKKTCRKYWNMEIADRIVQLKGIRFVNPQFELETTFDQDDFTRLLTQKFNLEPGVVQAFYRTVRGMNFYDDQSMTTRELFEKFFPGRNDVMRLLMEPITYANGSTLNEPAITYGIVFSNFMSQGVFTFEGGTDFMMELMLRELNKNGVDILLKTLVEEIVIEDRVTRAVSLHCRMGREKNRHARVATRAVLSNGNLVSTIKKLAGESHFTREFMERVNQVRINSSSCQVYLGIRPGESFDYFGDLVFVSDDAQFSSEKLLAMHTRSRTFSVYYPSTRSHIPEPRFTIVSSTNALYEDWASLDKEAYAREKAVLIEDTLKCLERFLPDIRGKLSHAEASTPRTFERYTLHVNGSSFGTKFEGLQVSQDLPKQVQGLFHAGSVGIIMSGWLGSANYGVIVSNEVDSYLSRG